MAGLTPTPTYPPTAPEPNLFPGPTATATVVPQQERLPETGGGNGDAVMAVALVLVVIGLVLRLAASRRKSPNS